MTSKYLDENDNNTERQALEKEINELITELNSSKKMMYNIYLENMDNIAFEGYNSLIDAQPITKSVCVPSRFKKKRKTTQIMSANFYNMFLKIVCRTKLDTIRFSFPRFDREQYGLQFRCRSIDKYFLEKCFLPHTFNMHDEKQNSYPVTYNEIPKYIEIVLENINAYSLREQQIEDFKKIMDKRIMMNTSLCFTDIDLNFKILTLDSSIRKCVNVNLFYPMLHILPSIVEVTVEGDILLKKYLEAIFAVFKEDFLSKAYQMAFVNSDQLKFFI